jgi:zinc transport system substrate-binding protein
LFIKGIFVKSIVTSYLLLAIVILFSISIQASAADHAKKTEVIVKGLMIVSSIKPLTLLIRALASPIDKVSQLLAADRSPHHYQLTVSDRQRLERADLVIWIGPELEGFLEKPLRQRQQGLITASELAAINWPEDGHEHAEKGDHQHERDPHLWLDPYNLGVLTEAIASALMKRAPHNADHYQANKNKLLRQLAALDQKLQKQLPDIANTPFIVMHPAYNHFVERYALNQQDYIVTTPERGIGAKHLYELKRLSVQCVFGEEGENDKWVKKVAKYSKAKVALLDPLGIRLADNASATNIIEQLAKDLSRCLATAN